MTIARDGSRVLIASALLLGLAGGVPGCDSVHKGPRKDLEWPWWPETMRIVDLTRVGRPNADGRRPIEVRILFEDAGGLPVRACGDLQVAVRRANEPDDPVVVELDLQDPAVSLEMFEEITGCYMIPVFVDFPGLIEGRRMEVVADYVGRDGIVLADELNFDLEMDIAD